MPTLDPKVIVTAKPKMTVNKLGEYLVASPTRQRRILEQLKYPKENKFGAVAHSDAREAIKQYFIKGFDENVIKNCIESLESKIPANDYQAIMNAASIEALEAVLSCEIINSDFEYHPYIGSNPKLDIKGVELSIYPDLIVKCKSKGTIQFGGLKLHLSKSSSITEEGNKYEAALIYKFLDENREGEIAELKAACCISYDIFQNTFIECPKSVKIRLDNIEAGCLNIVAIWDSI